MSSESWSNCGRLTPISLGLDVFFSKKANEREINEAVIFPYRVPKDVERETQHFVVVTYQAIQCFQRVTFHNRALDMILTVNVSFVSDSLFAFY